MKLGKGRRARCKLGCLTGNKRGAVRGPESGEKLRNEAGGGGGHSCWPAAPTASSALPTGILPASLLLAVALELSAQSNYL